MRFNQAAKDIKNTKSGAKISKLESFMESMKLKIELIRLNKNACSKKEELSLDLSEDILLITLPEQNNLSLPGMKEAKNEALAENLVGAYEKLREYEGNITNEDVESALALEKECEIDLSKLHKILCKEPLTFQATKEGEQITLSQSPKINTNIHVPDNAKILNCNIQSIRQDNNAVIVGFYGEKGSRKCLASMSVPTELEDIIHEYMKKRQRVDIYVSYGKGINPNARKINGQLLKVDESDTQTDFINF